MSNKPLSIKAVLFDFDGTLTEPGALNFSLLKETIGCPENSPILEFFKEQGKITRIENTMRVYQTATPQRVRAIHESHQKLSRLLENIPRNSF